MADRGSAAGLLVAESSFTRFYTAYSLYFVGNAAWSRTRSTFRICAVSPTSPRC